MTCKECEDLSGAYVLGAIPREEYYGVRVHLAQCPSCTRLYQELRAVVALLPLSVLQLDPPAYLKERILTAIQQEARSSSVEPQHSNVRPLRTPARQGWATRLVAIAAVLLLLLLGGMGIWNISLQKQLASVSPRVVTTMQGVAAPKTAAGEVFYLPQQNVTLLIMHGLPTLTGTHLYQGWLLHDSQPTSVGLLTIQNDTASLSFSGDVSGFNGIAISLEPGPVASIGGLAGPIIAKGTLKNST